jgi:hypothetical protein
MVLVGMLPEVSVHSGIKVNIIADAPRDLSFLIDAKFIPASLLEDKIVIKPVLTGMSCRLS